MLDIKRIQQIREAKVEAFLEKVREAECPKVEIKDIISEEKIAAANPLFPFIVFATPDDEYVGGYLSKLLMEGYTVRVFVAEITPVDQVTSKIHKKNILLVSWGEITDFITNRRAVITKEMLTHQLAIFFEEIIKAIQSDPREKIIHSIGFNTSKVQIMEAFGYTVGALERAPYITQQSVKESTLISLIDDIVKLGKRFSVRAFNDGYGNTSIGSTEIRIIIE